VKKYTSYPAYYYCKSLESKLKGYPFELEMPSDPLNKNIKTECDYFKDNTAEDLKKKFGIEKEKKTELEME